MASPRTALLLAFVACLAASAFGALPRRPFKNAGGPPFLDGPSYQWNATNEAVVTMGITADGNYSYASVGEDGAIQTELGVYTSWECGREPGSYVAIADLSVIDIEGNVVSTSTVCEFGYVYDLQLKNTWASSEDECPTEVSEENRFLGTREVTNECGTPPPDFTDVGDMGAPMPAARRMLL